MSATMILGDVLTAVVAYLRADTGIQAQVGNPARVYSHVPQPTAYPYIRVRCTSEEDGDKSQPGERVEIEVHCWSQAHGDKEVDAVVKAAYAALHNNPTAARSATVQTWLLVYRNTAITTEKDNVTRHAVARFFTRSQSPVQA